MPSLTVYFTSIAKIYSNIGEVCWNIVNLHTSHKLNKKQEYAVCRFIVTPDWESCHSTNPPYSPITPKTLMRDQSHHLALPSPPWSSWIWLQCNSKPSQALLRNSWRWKGVGRQPEETSTSKDIPRCQQGSPWEKPQPWQHMGGVGVINL